MKIKLRAWDIKNEKMLSWEELLAGREFKPKMIDPKKSEVILMMFTGILIEGQELYEYDKIQIRNDIFQVEYSKQLGSFVLVPVCLVEFTNKIYQFPDLPFQNAKIIGHRFQNSKFIIKEQNNYSN